MDDFLRPTVVKLQVVLISVDYRLAPEFPFPTGLNDSYAALKWALENAAVLKIYPSKGVLVGGASSGANFAGAIALRARDDHFFKQPGFSVTGQVLRVPSVVHPGADIPEEYKKELLSMEQNKDVPILNKSDILQIIEYYQAPPNDPDISILLAPSHSGLPPAFFQIAGYDTLRDEGILYEKVLKESGVQTKIEIYPGVPHGGPSPFPHLPAATKCANDFDKGLEWLLHDS
ncbi:AB hydrolase superfamily protein [Abortiporus biennis]